MQQQMSYSVWSDPVVKTTTISPLQAPQSSQSRTYHTTTVPQRSTVAIVLGLGAVSVGAYAISSVITAVKEIQKSSPPPPPSTSSTSDTNNDDSTTNTTTGTKTFHTTDGDAATSTAGAGNDTNNDTTSSSSSTTKTTSSGSKNIFEQWFGIGVNHKYYEGGFEEKMTRREAALILGIRESSTTARIKDAHRKLLVINHPDTGGSTYLTHKINEAKELLLKGRNDK
jgi:hypothetical protein